MFRKNIVDDYVVFFQKDESKGLLVEVLENVSVQDKKKNKELAKDTSLYHMSLKESVKFLKEKNLKRNFFVYGLPQEVKDFITDNGFTI